MPKTKLRVALGTVYPHDERYIRGGVEASAVGLAHALAARDDIDLHIVACHQDVQRPHTERRGSATIHWLPTGPRLHALRDITTEAWRVHKTYRRLRPDLIHAQDPSAFAIGAPAGVPVLLTVHGLELLAPSMRGLPIYQGFAGRYRRCITGWAMRRCLRRADALISVGGDYVVHMLAPFVAADVPRYTINNPVADVFFSIPDLPTDAPPLVLCPADIDPRKNQLGLVRALASVKKHVPDARLVLAGGVADPAYHARLLEEITRRELREDIALVGRLDQAALLDAYRKATVVALASVQETAPMSLTQALAAGRPVVATRVGGVGQIVADQETGLLIASGDDNALAANLTLLLTDARRRKTLAAAGRATALERFSGRSIAEQTVAAYRVAVSTECAQSRSSLRRRGGRGGR